MTTVSVCPRTLWAALAKNKRSKLVFIRINQFALRNCQGIKWTWQGGIGLLRQSRTNCAEHNQKEEGTPVG